jgi:hypothetical protein
MPGWIDAPQPVRAWSQVAFGSIVLLAACLVLVPLGVGLTRETSLLAVLTSTLVGVLGGVALGVVIRLRINKTRSLPSNRRWRTVYWLSTLLCAFLAVGADTSLAALGLWAALFGLMVPAFIGGVAQSRHSAKEMKS